jgi:hypothetical protein
MNCYLQEEDPPENHDLSRFSCVCGNCYGELADLEREARERLQAMHQVYADLLIDRDRWKEMFTQAMEQHGFTREFIESHGD